MADPVPYVDIASHSFSSSFRGFDPTEVRAYLTSLATEIETLRAQIARLEVQLADAEEKAARPDQIDDATLVSRLGEEAASLLGAARTGAEEIRARATLAGEHIRAEAQSDAARIREDAQLAARRDLDEARQRAAIIIDDAKLQGREMLVEAQAVRERVLADLTRRRNNGRSQLEQLRAGRDNLLAAFEQARIALEDVGGALRDAAPSAETGDALLAPADAEPVIARVELTELTVEVVTVEEPAPYDGRDDDLEDDPDEGPSVEDLFARIRAARVDELADQTDAASESLEETAAEEPASGVVDLTEVEPDTEPEAEAEAEPELDITNPFAARERALVDVGAGLSRRLKRALADEQNAVLDQLRRSTKVRDISDVLPDEAEHTGRYHEAVRDDLWSAAQAGARAATSRDDDASAMVLEARGVPNALRDDIARELVAPLRERTTRCIADAEGDPEEAAALLRSAYREWKVQRIEAVTGHLALLAYERGGYASLDPGTCVRWLVDPSGAPCADADDNVLAGAVRVGDAFPTGHLHAPAYPGCRCRVVATE
jgi:DivIVA domain-containing protein